MPDPEWFTSQAEAEQRVALLGVQWNKLGALATRLKEADPSAKIATAVLRSVKLYWQWRSGIDLNARDWFDGLEQWTSLANQYRERVALLVTDAPGPIPDIRQDFAGKTKKVLGDAGELFETPVLWIAVGIALSAFMLQRRR